MEAVCVDPAKVSELWPHASGLVKRAIDRGYLDFAEVEQNVLSGKSLLWIAWDGSKILGVAVTGLFGDACEIIAATGQDVRLWLHLIEVLEEYARAEGKTRTRIIGRNGWKRLLPNYKQTSIVLERAL